MGRKKYVCIISFAIAFLLIFTMVVSSSSGIFNRRKVVKIAIIRQRWDLLDRSSGIMFSTPTHKRCLRQAESRYDVKFEVYKFWDDFDSGDVQDGLLQELNIDVIIAPGGTGGFFAPEEYKKEIKKFVGSGGGFYGICGDSAFGSLGIKKLRRRYSSLIDSIFGFKEFPSMLGLANVYTDAFAFNYIVGNPKHFNKIDVVKFLTELPTSRVPIYFKPTNPPIQEPYFRKELMVMSGSVPLVDGPLINRLFMPRVLTIAIFNGYDAPYGRSIEGEKAIIATTYGRGRVILSAVHPELTVGNEKAHDVYIRNVLWLAGILPDT